SPTQRARASTGQYHASVKAAVALSRSLATRADGGEVPGQLAEADIVSFVSFALKSDGDGAGLRTIERVRALLNDCRDNDLAPSLRPSFAVQAHHLPDRTKGVSRSDGESALPDSTFAFLCGYDDLLGERTLDLLAAMPRLGAVDPGFAARELTALIRMAASFGRRPAELLALTCDRLRPGDRGGASVVYDNLKGARDAVPLPIDQVSAAEAAAWVKEVRERWPETPIEELCWFARFRANDGGRRPLAVNYIGTLFRDWTQFLDQAIVIAKLHSLTGLPAELLVELPTSSATALGLLAPDGTVHALSPETRVGLCDYKADWPAVDASGRLFPLPRSWAHRRRVATPLDRFAALGPDWLSIAARYASFGIPGDDLGRARARVRDVQFRRFRHTYLQHLVDLGTDIFIVQELADHSSVQTTIEAYVTPRVAQLRAAVDKLSEYRMDRHGRRLAGDEVRLPSTSDVLTNACSNPQVSSFNKEGCPNGRRCQSCDFLSVDPSHRDEIRAEILTLRKSVQHFEDLDQPERAAMAAEDLDAWRAVLAEVDALLGGLGPGERQVAENAIKAVRAMRNRMRNSSLPLGVTLEGQGS
ncbi:MAG: hypothetical protein M3417_15635, partial [Actinomycetota bacterium]|nr:hypothetical protein [Actinomycetota bacterium]